MCHDLEYVIMILRGSARGSHGLMRIEGRRGLKKMFFPELHGVHGPAVVCFLNSGDSMLRADIFEFAFSAHGFSRPAHLPAEQDQAVVDVAPLRSWKQGHKVPFDDGGVVGFRQSEAKGDPLHMGIDGDALMDIKCV
jgi:hypothetical protein